MFERIALISLGAVAGANLRYFLAQSVAKLIPSTWPFGTLIVNFSASLILGFFLVWTGERVLADMRWRLLIAVGFCGGYSTYSSYAFETFALLERSQWLLSGVYVLGMNLLCLAAVMIGAALARSL